MSRQFICDDCGASVFDASGGPERGCCFLCLWARELEPHDEQKRAELRALLDRE